jgi:hypothetical protein
MLAMLGMLRMIRSLVEQVRAVAVEHVCIVERLYGDVLFCCVSSERCVRALNQFYYGRIQVR